MTRVRLFTIKVVFLFVLVTALSFYGFFSAKALGLLAVVIAVVSLGVDVRSFGVVSSSIVIGTGLGLLILGWVAPRVEKATTYRPFEVLQTALPEYGGVRVYRPGAVIEDFQMPYGDLSPLIRRSAGAPSDVIDLEPRTVDYRIDDIGFRNDDPYSGQRWLLVGDSFVAGDDNDQADTLSRQLRLSHGIDAYSVAHPGNPADYVRLLQYFDRVKVGQGARQARVILFLFEGNDFDFDYEPQTEAPFMATAAASVAAEATSGGAVPESASVSSLAAPPRLGVVGSASAALRALRDRQKETALYRLTYSVFSRFKYDFLQTGGQVTEGLHVLRMKSGGKEHKIGFSAKYVAGARMSEADVDDKAEVLTKVLKPIENRTEAIVFIPSKFRVYAPILSTSESDRALPERAWKITQSTCDRLRVRCLDLTGPLRLAARDKLVYWKDDTHWNRAGIAIGAAEVARFIREAN